MLKLKSRSCTAKDHGHRNTSFNNLWYDLLVNWFFDFGGLMFLPVFTVLIMVILISFYVCFLDGIIDDLWF